MRTPAPDARPVALTIAGSDSGGGAGIQADLATMTAHGAFGTSAITAVTAQHTRGVESSFVLPVEEVEAQLAAVTDDFDVGAAKTGMLATPEIVRLVTDRASEFEFPLVVDPVMVATSGDRLLEPAAETAYEDLLAEATLATPNADEAEVLSGISVDDGERAREAGEAILETGVDAVLVKGGHISGKTVRDRLITGEGVETFEHARIDTEATHGSGCTLAAAIAARLARGEPLEPAVEGATEFLARAVRYHYDVGRGPGAVNHAVELRNAAAREPTAEAVQSIVSRLVDHDVSRLVPEVGMTVVGATPAAESVAETAAVEGRITRTLDGVHPNRGVRFGASTHLASFLLTVRESVPERRFAANCRLDEEIETALSALGWDTVELEAGGALEPRITDRETPPTAVIEPADVGREGAVKLLAESSDSLTDRLLELCDRSE
jgi:hydroxymethylpyrimidine kinase / phosphomethylpyrimidine kinase / thiamine-phosphate diphosphorylase